MSDSISNRGSFMATPVLFLISRTKIGSGGEEPQLAANIGGQNVIVSFSMMIWGMTLVVLMT